MFRSILESADGHRVASVDHEVFKGVRCLPQRPYWTGRAVLFPKDALCWSGRLASASAFGCLHVGQLLLGLRGGEGVVKHSVLVSRAVLLVPFMSAYIHSSSTLT